MGNGVSIITRTSVEFKAFECNRITKYLFPGDRYTHDLGRILYSRGGQLMKKTEDDYSDF